MLFIYLTNTCKAVNAVQRTNVIAVNKVDKLSLFMNLHSIYGRQQMNKLENKDTVCETYYSRNKVCVPDIN